MASNSRLVGTMSMTCCNWERISPRALIPFGQLMPIPFRVPPSVMEARRRAASEIL